MLVTPLHDSMLKIRLPDEFVVAPGLALVLSLPRDLPFPADRLGGPLPPAVVLPSDRDRLAYALANGNTEMDRVSSRPILA